jgi:hypothetical protein
MIEDALHKAIITRISQGDYFREEPPVLIVAQEEPDGDVEDDLQGGEPVSESIDPAKLINDALNTAGLVAEVLYPDWNREKGGLTTFTGAVHLLENRFQNRKAATGARRRGRNAARAVCSLLDGFRPYTVDATLESLGNTWLVVTGREYLGSDGAKHLWEVRWELQTRLEVIEDYLADETGGAVLDENDGTISTSDQP